MAFPETLLQAAQWAAKSSSGVVFVGHGGRETRLGYDQLLARAMGAAGQLARIGVGYGDRVAIVMRTGPSFYDALLGAWIVGAVPVPLYPPLNLGGLKDYETSTSRMLRAASCTVVITEKFLSPLLASTARMAGLSCPPVVLEKCRRGDPEVHGSSPDDSSLIQFSSGTTGNPKGALLTNRQILANVAAIHSFVLDAEPEQGGLRHVCVCWLPLYHDMGLIGCLIAAMTHGAELVLIPPTVFLANPSTWLRAISDHGGTVSPSPNFAFSYCAERIDDAELTGVDLSSWKLALNGAEAVTAEAMNAFLQRFEAFGFDAEALTPVYGLSEMTLLVTANRGMTSCSPLEFDSHALENEGRAELAPPGSMRALSLVSVGKPVSGTAIEIRGRDGSCLPPATLGSIVVRGPSLMEGYVGSSQDPIDTKGWLRTGDLGFLHDGELFLFSREDDIVVIRGRNFAPEGFERAAAVVQGTRRGRVAAIGVGDTASGTDKLVLLVERHSRSTHRDATLAEEVGRCVLEETGIRPADVRVLPRGSLPCTSSGKVRRREARRRFVPGVAGHAPVVAAAVSAGEMRS